MTSSSRRINWTREWPLLQGCKTRRYNKTFKNALLAHPQQEVNSPVAEPMQTDNGKSLHHEPSHSVGDLGSLPRVHVLLYCCGYSARNGWAFQPNPTFRLLFIRRGMTQTPPSLLPRPSFPACTACCSSLSRSDSSMPDLHSLQSRIRALQTSTPILARDAADVMRGRQVSTCATYSTPT